MNLVISFAKWNYGYLLKGQVGGCYTSMDPPRMNLVVSFAKWDYGYLSPEHMVFVFAVVFFCM